MEDAVFAGVGHEDIGRVLVSGTGPVAQRGDLVAPQDDIRPVGGGLRRTLRLWDLVVIDVKLKVQMTS